MEELTIILALSYIVRPEFCLVDKYYPLWGGGISLIPGDYVKHATKITVTGNEQ